MKPDDKIAVTLTRAQWRHLHTIAGCGYLAVKESDYRDGFDHRDGGGMTDILARIWKDGVIHVV